MKKKLAKAISERLRALRESAGLSQQEVAMKGDLSMSLVAKLEQAKKADPRASTILALAQALGVKPGKILDDLPLLPDDEPVPATAAANGVPGENGKAKKKKVKKQKKKVKEAN